MRGSGENKYNNSRYFKKTLRCGLVLACAGLLLSGCAVDKLKDLDVVYDLTQEDQKQGASMFEYADGSGTDAPQSSTEDAADMLTQDTLPRTEDNTDPSGSETGVTDAGAQAPLEEDIQAIQEQMEIALNKPSREEIEREDEEKRKALGLTEGKILEIMKENAGKYYYRHLSPDEQRVYAEILHIIRNRGEKIKISAMDENTMDKVFQYVMADHPEIFYADGYTYTRYTINGELIKLGFTARYLYALSEQERREAKIADAVKKITLAAPKTTDQYETARYVYEYIINHTDYTLGAPDNQNICSVFLGGESVCQGYAKAAQLLLDELGLEATLVIGTVTVGSQTSGRHAWNLVTVNGQTYYMDPTWGDATFQQAASEEEPDDHINYDYMLNTTKELETTHVIGDLVEMPECTHLEDNYYVRDGAWFTEANDEQFRTLFMKAYREKRDELVVKCADDAAYDAVTQYLVTDRHIFDYLERPEQSATFSSSDRRRTLTFMLS